MKTKIMHPRITYQRLSTAFVVLALTFGAYSSLNGSQEEYSEQLDFLRDPFGDDDVVVYLGEYKNPDIEMTNLVYNTIQNDDLTTLKELINKGADVNAGSRRHKLSPLAYAIKRDACYEIIALLIEKGACLDASSLALLSPYMRAIFDTFTGNLSAVRSVIKSTADCEKAEQEGFFLLHAAAYSGHLDLVQFLVNRGFSVNQLNTRHQNPIFLAAYAGHKDIVEYFISKGAKLNKRDQFGLTALEAACFYGHQQVVRTLLVHGSRLNVGPNKPRIYPLFIAACGGHTNTVEDFILLLEDINQPAYYGRRPLHAAAMNGHLKTVELLVSYGADVESTDDDGNTPLHFAARQNHCEIISYLVQHGADFWRPNKQGRTAFDYTLDFRHDVRTTLRRLVPENCVKEICEMIPLEYIPREMDYRYGTQSVPSTDIEDADGQSPTKRRRVA